MSAANAAMPNTTVLIYFLLRNTCFQPQRRILPTHEQHFQRAPKTASPPVGTRLEFSPAKRSLRPVSPASPLKGLSKSREGESNAPVSDRFLNYCDGLWKNSSLARSRRNFARGVQWYLASPHGLHCSCSILPH